MPSLHTTHPARTPNTHGFTLLETAITLFIVALLVAAVFGILQSSLQLADNIRGEQERELRVQKFVELCETIFNRLPPDAVISIRPEKGFGSQSQLLEITHALSPFDAATPGVVTLSTTKAKDGSAAILLAYEEVPVNFASTQRQNTTRPVQLALLQDVSTFSWRVFDPQAQQWIVKWNENVTAADLLKNGSTMIPSAALPPEGQNLALNPVPTASGAPAVGADGQPVPTTPPDGTPQAAAGNTSAYPRPPMLELLLATSDQTPRSWIFWVPASFSQ